MIDRRNACLRGNRMVATEIAVTGEQSGDGDVLVKRIPVQTQGTDPHLFALRWRAMQQPRKPGQWHAECAPVGQLDPQGVAVAMDAFSPH